MLTDITIGQYFPGNSLLHKMDPRAKLILTFAYIVAVFVPRNWAGLSLAVAFLVMSVWLSHLPLKLIFKSLKPILPLIVFTSIINIFYVRDGLVLVDWWIIHITLAGRGHRRVHRGAHPLPHCRQLPANLYHLAHRPDRCAGTADETPQVPARQRP